MREHAHLRLSTALVAVFLGVGLVLEGLYGLRPAEWMDDPIRRDFLRLGHAHGAVLGLLNLALAWVIHRLGTPEVWASRIRLAAWLAAVLVGIGFVGGGLFHGPTDPGPIVLIVPAGALMLLAALMAAAWVGAEPGTGSDS